MSRIDAGRSAEDPPDRNGSRWTGPTRPEASQLTMPGRRYYSRRPARAANVRRQRPSSTERVGWKEGGGFMVRIRIGAIVAATAILFAACGTAASPSPSASSPAATSSSPPAESTAPSAAPSAAVKEGGTLVVALPGDITRTDRRWSTTATRRTSGRTSWRGLAARSSPDRRPDPPDAREKLDGQPRRPDLHVQAPHRRQVPRRDGLQRRRGQVQLRPLDQHPKSYSLPATPTTSTRSSPRRWRDLGIATVRPLMRRRSSSPSTANLGVPDRPDPDGLRDLEPHGPQGREGERT